MYNSITQFIKNETIEMEIFINKFINGEKDMDELSYYLSNRINELVKNMISELFEQIDKEIRESDIRLSEGWIVEKNKRS